MAHLLEDPRLRQRWNQFSHTTETVTENAAAGIYSFQHRYLNPCLSSLGDAIDPCIAPCFGDRDERMRRARAREYQINSNAARAEYTFDFYDDWDDDDELLASGNTAGGVGGILGGWGGAQGGGGGGGRGEDWDRLIGGSGITRKSSSHAAEIADQQPRRKRGMSYGTRGAIRRKTGSDEEDPTIIPSTAPLGFLGRLPWKIGGTLRYKPSAAFLKDHPGAPSGRPDEVQPLLEESGDDMDFRPQIAAHTRKRSGTGGSGDTSDSYRSRGDLFPSDGEEYEDAMEIDDEFAVALERVDDRASSNTRSSKGKRPADSRRVSRAASGTTLSSSASRSSLRARRISGEPSPTMEDSIHSIRAVSIEDLRREDEEVGREEDQEVARKREAAARIARERGLSQCDNYDTGESESRAKSAIFRVEEISEPNSPQTTDAHEPPPDAKAQPEGSQPQTADAFIPARLPNFR
ncbi:hypothetical protein N0V82_000707 [Gnomoniopsis sp. IMI 355080]|nr:hypothetical protein N0V82_000707 [Gnomoniopsis sp. IMI 355080]